MSFAIILLFAVVSLECRAEKVPMCDQSSNPGVLKFGPLPAGLRTFGTTYKQLYDRTPLPKYQLQGLMDRFLVEYAEYADGYDQSSSYLILFIKDMEVYRLLDYLRVNPNSWRDFEKAVVDADHQPNSDSTIRIKFMESDCDCTMRTYDLKSPNIPASATSAPCRTAPQMNNPYNLAKVETHLSNPIKGFFIFDEYTKYPTCKQGTTVGVYKEFGPLHPHLLEPAYFTPVTPPTVTSLTFTGTLSKYKVDYSEYRDVAGSGTYSYLTLSYDASGLNMFVPVTGPEYKVIDYLRVDRAGWARVQEAVLEGSETPSTNMRLRVKFLTTDCSCVMRVYDLRQRDIPLSAETRACDGHILPGWPHALKGAAHQAGLPVLVQQANSGTPVSDSSKYPRCDPNNNEGVLNEFGPLPRDLTLGNHYRQNIYSAISGSRFTLEGNLRKFTVEYKEFEDKFATGTGTYAFLILNYNDGVQETLLDYIRVNHLKWQEIENAIVSVDEIPNGGIRMQFLISDCSCVTREYHPNIAELFYRGKTVPCPSTLGPLPLRKSTQLTNRQFNI